MTTYTIKTAEVSKEQISKLPKEFILRNEKCPRCCGLHEALLFKKLALINPPLYFSYWSMCPKTKEPILIAIVSEDSYSKEFQLSSITFDKS